MAAGKRTKRASKARASKAIPGKAAADPAVAREASAGARRAGAGHTAASSARPTISACLIVRDEARLLPRCLRSIAGAYDELCIVDTGSSDNTLEIARKAGARTLRFTECNGADGKIEDFAAPRNAALQLATSDWILQIDADEVLGPGGGARVRQHSRHPEVTSVMVNMRSGPASWLSERLHRRSGDLRYVGRIHEYVERDGEARAVIDRRIVITNRPDKRGKETAEARNVRLLQLELADNPRNARALYQLGNELRGGGRLDEAIARYRASLELGTYRHGRFVTRYYLAVCYVRKHDWDLAIATAHDAVRVDPRYAEAHCLLGDVYFARGQLAFARQWYRSALACGTPPETAMAVQTWAYGAYPKHRLRMVARALRLPAGEAPPDHAQ
jgi:glycosyltransferase involved in cell wall biosynthesis